MTQGKNLVCDSCSWFIHTHTHILHFIIFYLAVYGYDDVASFERVGDNMGRIHQLIN